MSRASTDHRCQGLIRNASDERASLQPGSARPRVGGSRCRRRGPGGGAALRRQHLGRLQGADPASAERRACRPHRPWPVAAQARGPRADGRGVHERQAGRNARRPSPAPPRGARDQRLARRGVADGAPARPHAQEKSYKRPSRTVPTSPASAGAGGCGSAFSILTRASPPTRPAPAQRCQRKDGPALRLAPKGERVVDAVPHGHRRATTFVCGLTMGGLVAPLVPSGLMPGPPSSPTPSSSWRLRCTTAVSLSRTTSRRKRSPGSARRSLLPVGR